MAATSSTSSSSSLGLLGSSLKALPELRKTCLVGGTIWLRYKITPTKKGNNYSGEIRLVDRSGEFRLADKLNPNKYFSAPFKLEGKIESTLSAPQINQLINSGDFQITVIPKNNMPKGKDIKGHFIISITRLPSSLPAEPAIQLSTDQLLQRSFHYIFFERTQDLAVAFRQSPSNEILKKIIDRMVDRFSKHNGRANGIEEMVALISLLDDQNSFLVIKKLIKEIRKTPLHQQNVLNGLINILRSYQRSTYQELVERSKDENSIPVPSQVLSPETLVKMAQVLSTKVTEFTSSQSKINNTPGYEPSHLVYLKALVGVLEVMEMTELKQLERKDYHDPFYKLLLEYDYAANLKVAFFAALGKQVLAQIPNDETNLHSFLRHCFHFGNCCLNLYKAYSEKSLNALADAGRSFLKAVQVPEGEADWYVTLFSIEYALKTQGIKFLQSFKYLVQWAELGHLESKKVVQRLHTTNPFFVFGLIQAFQRFIDYQAGTTPEAYWLPFYFLEKIGKDNKPSQDNASPEKNDGIFTIDMTFTRKFQRLIKQQLPDILKKGAPERTTSYAGQVYQEVIELLKNYVSHHPAHAIRELAKGCLQQLSEPKEKIPAYNPLPPPQAPILNHALNKIAPYCQGFRKEYENLIKDEQLEQEERYYIKTQVKNESGVVKDLHDYVREFLRGKGKDDVKSKDDVLLLTGLAGSGKSLSIKHFVKESWEKGLPEDYIPIVVSLATVSDPVRAITDTLRKRGLNINDIQNLKILWVFDALDESKEGAATNHKLYRLMELYLWPNSKFIFIARTGISDEKIASLCPREGSRNGLLHLNILPFDRNKINQYLSQFSEIRRQENAQNKSSAGGWEKPEAYTKFLDENPSLDPLFSTPLYLSITAKVLPLIIQQRKEKGDPKANISNILKTDVLDALFCSNVGREINKKKSASTGWEEKKGARIEYLDYAIEVVKIFKDFERITKRAWIPKEEAETKHPNFFNETDGDIILKRRCCAITLSESGANLEPSIPHSEKSAKSEASDSETSAKSESSISDSETIAKQKLSENVPTSFYGYSHTTFLEYFFALLDPTRAGEVRRLLKSKVYEPKF